MNTRPWVPLLLLGLLVFAIYTAVRSRRMPHMDLRTQGGERVWVDRTEGRPLGVLIYFSRTPCQGHLQVLPWNVGAKQLLDRNPKFHTIVVYGDDTAEAAAALAQEMPIPVALDPGRRLAKALGFEYYGVVIFDPKGKVLKRIEGGNYQAGPGLDGYLEKLAS